MRKSDHDYANARRLRRQQSLPEGLLWRELRARKSGLKFRRQHPVGDYVLDFYCAAAELAIEVDGKAHDMGDRPERDEKKDAWLSEHGIAVMRVPASEVLRDTVGIADAIVIACLARCT